ncbi:peptide ABC transporter ATP-binding protein [Erwinia sp. OLTSP20]|uniref:oligopeptide/dipeptide ABC transporter ATP-binding protein n=1 Tax=unclassified Erwinia TaxID=2622719 RepID=UPI000C182031|nr:MULTISPECIES: ABC transporter ATP-binding protein [unclassified Erwinia]PIJ49404.1 peptide ABC transporter ATP-binding protein [Erwinia sp. OAMSP11]PIJ71080.1 peptide ABC transporter ATP-binding protein [Erwinia sp. OLSSP12]PIJ79358.1 peptide ABC transporter ATP-binding protein [Erwinia sp. OLCASP19]PIJ80896.1 peptide ABC transporter ATP-binding protein [Erwinia sp. OLMTSP26]PIJ83698.1 peptide ABC transporter ATP-binding protein [Erwinia sp. OLMDSP33]
MLEIDDLVVRYKTGNLLSRLQPGATRHIEVLAGVSLQVPAGKTVGLIGESGSGKTTLGRAVIGLAPISRGSVLVNGWQPRDGSDFSWRPVRRETGLIFQDPMAALDPRMTVAQLVTEPFSVNGIEVKRRQAAAQLLDQVGLSSLFLDRYPHQLSGGQARRVAVARALALRPKLIIADEPTAGLDLSVQGELLNLMTSLQRELGMSYLMITHNLAITRHVTDLIAIMYLGRIVESGPTAALFRAPAHPYTRALLSAKEKTGGSVLQGEIPTLAQRPHGCEFHTRCPLATERCRQQAPLLRPLRDQHQVSCHTPLIND